MIHAERVKALSDRGPSGGAYVLYWMQASQRASGKQAPAWEERKALAKLPFMSQDVLCGTFDMESYVRRSDDAYNAYGHTP